MTALKPIEGRSVRGVAAYKYPLNKLCAHPECYEPTMDAHHIFPRSLIGNQSWFVQVQDSSLPEKATRTWIIPHVIGMCRMHHDDVEQHRAWIKLEENLFVWYDRHIPEDYIAHRDPTLVEYEKLGPLDPQPALAVKASKKPRRKAKSGPRPRWTIAVPKDQQEDGAELLDAAVEQIEKLLGHDPPRSKYYSLIDGLNFGIMWLEDDDG